MARSKKKSSKKLGKGEKWVTINGTPVLLGADGKPKGKVGKKIMSSSSGRGYARARKKVSEAEFYSAIEGALNTPGLGPGGSLTKAQVAKIRSDAAKKAPKKKAAKKASRKVKKDFDELDEYAQSAEIAKFRSHPSMHSHIDDAAKNRRARDKKLKADISKNNKAYKEKSASAKNTPERLNALEEKYLAVRDFGESKGQWGAWPPETVANKLKRTKNPQERELMKAELYFAYAVGRVDLPASTKKLIGVSELEDALGGHEGYQRERSWVLSRKRAKARRKLTATKSTKKATKKKATKKKVAKKLPKRGYNKDGTKSKTFITAKERTALEKKAKKATKKKPKKVAKKKAPPKKKAPRQKRNAESYTYDEAFEDLFG